MRPWQHALCACYATIHDRVQTTGRGSQPAISGLPHTITREKLVEAGLAGSALLCHRLRRHEAARRQAEAVAEMAEGEFI